jgi:hypothetical protein
MCDGFICRQINRRLTEDKYKTMVKNFSLFYLYCYLNTTHWNASDSNFQDYESILKIFFEQNPDELGKIVAYAIHINSLQQIPSILLVFIEIEKAVLTTRTGNDIEMIKILESSLNQFLTAVCGIRLCASSLDKMNQLQAVLTRHVPPNSEILAHVNSFLADQAKLAKENPIQAKDIAITAAVVTIACFMGFAVDTKFSSDLYFKRQVAF